MVSRGLGLITATGHPTWEKMKHILNVSEDGSIFSVRTEGDGVVEGTIAFLSLIAQFWAVITRREYTMRPGGCASGVAPNTCNIKTFYVIFPQ